MAEPAQAAQEARAALLAALDRSLRALGDSGAYDLACRIAADAWSALRTSDADGAERLNRTLHYLTARMKPRGAKPPGPGRGEAGAG